MQFEFTEPQSVFEEVFGGHHLINAFGKIEVGDCDKFFNFLQTTMPPPRCSLYISSEGGSVDDAMKIGILIRAHQFSTHVGMRTLNLDAPSSPILSRLQTNSYCMSSATLMYLGGKLRYLDENAKFGVHQFSFRNPTAETVEQSQRLSADISFYLAEMGIDASFLQLSTSSPNDQIELIPKETLEELGVVTGGITPVDWTVQSRNTILYVKGERDSLFGHHKVMLGFKSGSGFLFWAVIEAQGRESELTNFGLIELTLNNANQRIDISDRSERQVHGQYVNILAPISPEEAEAIALSENFGIQVRHSSDADIFLGVSGMDTTGAEDMLQTFVANLK